MTRREKVLATTLMAVLVLGGGGVLLHLFVIEPVAEVRGQLTQAQEQYAQKQAELAQEQRQIDQILRVNPRLTQWQKISLPPRDPEAKKKPGSAPEELKRKHLATMQVEYESYLFGLLGDSGFRRDSIVVTAGRSDRRNAAKGKESPYERMVFAVAGKAPMDGVVRMLREFYRTPLLHQVRNLTLGLASNTGGGGGGAGARRPLPPGTLDVSMTVEALLVAGAEERSGLMPSTLAYAPRVLAEPGRDYTKMGKRNMFTGVEPPRRSDSTQKVTEERADVLRFIKLTMLFYNPERKRWEATLYDQARGPRRVEEEEDGVKKVSVIWEKQLNTRILNELVVQDKYENTILDAKVVLIDEQQMVLKADKQFFRLRCGDALYPAVEKPLTKDEVRALGLDPDD
jgi:hypothetical protein